MAGACRFFVVFHHMGGTANHRVTHQFSDLESKSSPISFGDTIDCVAGIPLSGKRRTSGISGHTPSKAPAVSASSICHSVSRAKHKQRPRLAASARASINVSASSISLDMNALPFYKNMVILSSITPKWPLIYGLAFTRLQRVSGCRCCLNLPFSCRLRPAKHNETW